MDISPEIKKEAYKFLSNNNTAVIATIYKGEPYASTVHFESDEEMNIYFLSHMNTSKYINVSHHQSGALVVGTGPKHISIQARGIVDIVVGDTADEIKKHFNFLKESNFIENPPIDNMSIFQDREPVVFKFEALEMYFMNLDDDDYPHSKSTEYYRIM